MTLFRSKVWSPVDIALFKWCCIFFGMIAGAYLSALVKDYVWVFVTATVLLAIKPTVSYFRADQADR